MEEAPENSKELSHSAHANGMKERNLEVVGDILIWNIDSFVIIYCDIGDAHCDKIANVLCKANNFRFKLEHLYRLQG